MHSCAITRYLRLGNLYKHQFVSHSSGGWEGRGEGTSRLSYLVRAALCFRGGSPGGRSPHAYPGKTEGQASLSKEPSGPNYLLKSSRCHAITLTTPEFWRGHIQTIAWGSTGSHVEWSSEVTGSRSAVQAEEPQCLHLNSHRQRQVSRSQPCTGGEDCPRGRAPFPISTPIVSSRVSLICRNGICPPQTQLTRAETPLLSSGQ